MGVRQLLKRVRTLDKEAHVVFYGLDGSGKSAIIHCMSGEPLATPTPTSAFDVRRATLRGYQFNLWDIGGCFENRTRWESFLEQADVVVWVVDTANRERLPELQTEFDRFLKIIAERFSTLLILSNPIGEAICPPERLSTLFDLSSFPDLKVTILPCNPFDPPSVQQILAWIYRWRMSAENSSE
jgi:hypothetical protein